MALLIRWRGCGWALRRLRLGLGPTQGETRQGLGTGQVSRTEMHQLLMGEKEGIKRTGEKGAQHPPAFLVVKYIIRFFFFSRGCHIGSLARGRWTSEARQGHVQISDLGSWGKTVPEVGVSSRSRLTKAFRFSSSSWLGNEPYCPSTWHA